ncbi:MAG: hypothetical protein A2579_03405 [Lysobacterales bacterium RIFOXYD1_FULL_69_11]|nr:MAG: hypothetical protein A2190_09450 [Xanthomonadales bacterium RIFOXYA1_FULL_69_10]OHE86632.1 MAG: hypothetical protein A2579_03405 [Xanthomonadales bacterium RIFOXYD1_FULL_69_11]
MTLRLPVTARSGLLLTALLALAACSSQEGPAPGERTADPAAASTPAAPAEGQAAPAASETPATPTAPGEAAPPQGPAPTLGVEYFEISGGQPFAPGPAGTVEVVEVFGYTCPACARFEPLVSAWKARQPAYVRFTPVAAPFGGYWMPYAKAFYAADSMGLREKTHDAMFQAVHVDRSLPAQGVSDEQIAEFYAGHGANAQEFANTMSSFAVDARMKRATQFLQRSGVDSTPTMLVDGKYRVASGMPYEEVLRITDHLVARARAENAPAAPGGETAPEAATDADAEAPAAEEAAG